MKESRIKALVLHSVYTDKLSYYNDWLDAFANHAEFDCDIVNIAAIGARRVIREHLSTCDAVVLLHSTNADHIVHLTSIADLLNMRRGTLLVFAGNECNLPNAPMRLKRAVFKEIAPDWIATQLLPEAGEYLFGDIPRRGIVSLPHALNPTAFSPKYGGTDRPIDIGARVHRYLPHLGDTDRNRINDKFTQLGCSGRLKVDISEQRFDRGGWADFLNRCKGTVSSEAGSWFLERDDESIETIAALATASRRGVTVSSNSFLVQQSFKLPSTIRHVIAMVAKRCGLGYSYQGLDEANLKRICETVFAGRERCPSYSKCISSRHFDAIGTKTCQIMLRGRFNDILEADRHYIALAKDFSNIDDVLRRFLDDKERLRIADEAYERVMAGHTYGHRMKSVADLLRSV